MKSIIIAGALAAILGTASSHPLNYKRDYVTEIVIVTETVTDAFVYVDQDGKPYSTSVVGQSTAAESVEVVTTSEAVSTAPGISYAAPVFEASSASVVPTVTPSISYAVPVPEAPSATPSASVTPPSFSLVPDPEPTSVQAQNEPSTTPAVESVAPATTSSPEPSSPPPAPVPSSAAPASSQVPQVETADAGALPFGVTYDPFTGTEGNSRCKTDAEIADEFSRMSSYKVVRIYGMGCNIISLAVQNAQKNGQTLMGGAYLSNRGNGEDLSSVITTWKDAIDRDAGGSWDILKLFSVENERLNDHDMTASEIVDAIRRGRDQLRGVGYQGPVGAVETVPATIDNPAICKAADVVMVNCHPFFDPNTAAEDAGTFVKGQIERVKTACDTDRVIVTETGWPHQGDANGKAVPSPDNQAKALASIRSEFKSDVFLHNSFDSLWKSDWASSFNAERYWGVIQ
ncbi:soluble cell wall protein-like protein [Boeremia exigua]|uniref:soluble cell wall protein-like protein n=1 Tax=Boeremia exigua TaxID=749465 RepID=UPI001E8D2922|nr:soluble cell wall protein-like protein [Boeremia exigua]KAH6637479.1 soluble cell wall protein-like protein [Boeremia exigua]